MGRGRVAGVTVVVGVLLVAGVGAVALQSQGRPHRVEVARSPLQFDVPHEWRDTTRDQDPTLASVVQAAQQQGLAPEDYADRLRSSMRATVVGPPAGGRFSTIDVQDSEFPTLPSTPAVRSRLEALHEQVVDSRVVPTGVGTAVVTRYRVPLGAETITGDVVYVAVGGEVLAITVSSARESVVTPLTEQVLATLRAE